MKPLLQHLEMIRQEKNVPEKLDVTEGLSSDREGVLRPEQENECSDLLLEAGTVYTDFVRSCCGMKTISPETVIVPEDIQLEMDRMKSVIDAGLKENCLVFQMGKFDARKILNQVLREERQQQMLEDTSQYRLEEPTEGVYMIRMKNDFYRDIWPADASAVAWKVSEGVSFIIVPEYESEAIDQNRLEENLPHETQHILWHFLRKGGGVTTNERGEDEQKAFLMFQDELMARIVSGGTLSGYTHLRQGDNAERLQTTSPEVFEYIKNQTGKLNDMLLAVDSLLMEREISEYSLLMTVLRSKDFSSLEENVLRAKEEIMKIPPKEVVYEEGLLYV